MFDCGGPTLVFASQTLHPLLGHPTGLIFALYNVEAHKPRELFFSDFLEVQVFAKNIRARIEMNPDRKPERITAADFLSVLQDDSRFMHIPEFRTNTAILKRRGMAPDVDCEMEMPDEDEFLTEEDVCPE